MKSLAELIEEESRGRKPKGRAAAKPAGKTAKSKRAARADRARKARAESRAAGARAVAALEPLAVPLPDVLDAHAVQTFCHAYLFRTGFNATRAYLEVNPAVTEKSAGELGYRMLKRMEVQHQLVEMAKAAVERNELDRSYIIGRWIAMSKANVVDYFDQDDEGVLHLKQLTELPLEVQRNVRKIKVTKRFIENKYGPPLVEQRVELDLIDAKGVLDSMAKAGGLFGDVGAAEERSDVAAAIEQGFERVRQAMGGRTFDGATGVEVQAFEGELAE